MVYSIERREEFCCIQWRYSFSYYLISSSDTIDLAREQGSFSKTHIQSCKRNKLYAFLFVIYERDMQTHTHSERGNCRSGRVFANGPGDLGSIPGCVIPKTLKTVLDTSLLNIQHYKVRIKGKVDQSRERSSALPYTSV